MKDELADTPAAGPGPAPVCVNCGLAAYRPDGAPAWLHAESDKIECEGGLTDCEPVLFLGQGGPP